MTDGFSFASSAKAASAISRSHESRVSRSPAYVFSIDATYCHGCLFQKHMCIWECPVTLKLTSHFPFSSLRV